MRNGLYTDSHGTKRWYLNDLLHRTDGPAVEYTGGTKGWYLNGKRHRTDGPAVGRANGTKKWYLNGKLHRTDGPAVDYAVGTKFWYLNDSLMLFNKWLEENNEITDSQKVLLKLKYG